MSEAASGTRRRGYGRGPTEVGSIATASVIDDDDAPRRDMMGLWNPNGEVSIFPLCARFCAHVVAARACYERTI